MLSNPGAPRVQPSLRRPRWCQISCWAELAAGRARCGQSAGGTPVPRGRAPRGAAWDTCHGSQRGVVAGEALPCFAGFLHAAGRQPARLPPPPRLQLGFRRERRALLSPSGVCLHRSTLIPGYCRPKLHLIFLSWHVFASCLLLAFPRAPTSPFPTSALSSVRSLAALHIAG